MILELIIFKFLNNIYFRFYLFIIRGKRGYFYGKISLEIDRKILKMKNNKGR